LFFWVFLLLLRGHRKTQGGVKEILIELRDPASALRYMAGVKGIEYSPRWVAIKSLKYFSQKGKFCLRIWKNGNLRGAPELFGFSESQSSTSACAEARMPAESVSQIEKIFHPRSIAVTGVSDKSYLRNATTSFTRKWKSCATTSFTLSRI
jgi:hypothetical protein